MREDLIRIEHAQNDRRAIERRDRNIVEQNFDYVNRFSVMSLALFAIVGLLQVFMIRSLFEEKSVLKRIFKNYNFWACLITLRSVYICCTLTWYCPTAHCAHNCQPWHKAANDSKKHIRKWLAPKTRQMTASHASTARVRFQTDLTWAAVNSRDSFFNHRWFICSIFCMPHVVRQPVQMHFRFFVP